MNLARDMDVSYTSEEVCQANSSLSSSQTGGFVSTRSLSQWLPGCKNQGVLEGVPPFRAQWVEGKSF